MTGNPFLDEQVPVRHFGGPTALIEFGGLRLQTDPTLDPPGAYPPSPRGTVLVKTARRGTTPAELGAVDVVLLSHDEHTDNLDIDGRAFLLDIPLTLTTRGGADGLGGSARGLAAWESVAVSRPMGGTVTITAVPARHGPVGAEAVLGEVVGSSSPRTTCRRSTSAATTPRWNWSSRSPSAADRSIRPCCSLGPRGRARSRALWSPSTAPRPPRPRACWERAASCPPTMRAGRISRRAATTWSPRSPRRGWPTASSSATRASGIELRSGQRTPRPGRGTVRWC
jgi:hypothetical protein